MDHERPNPEMLLKQISNNQNENGRGKLKIFFGYAAGVGKTFAMLAAAHEAKKNGIDVVIGYVEPHLRPQTLALVNGLEGIPTVEIKYRDITLKEFDIDAAIKRHPELILVDELAHTNAKGSRHLKRYQDIEELLTAGINVYTTVNVQHIESLNDIVESITGIAVRERIPDSVFDSADQVELMDIEPDDLIERLNKGKIYRDAQAQKALKNFFTKENLIALREIALRRTADRVNIAVEKNKALSTNNDYTTDEHILVCLSSSPSNAKIIRTAARMTEAFHGSLTAIFAEPSSFAEMSDDNRARLRENIKLAEQLGGKIITVYGDDVPELIAEYAKASGISKIVIGRPTRSKFWLQKQNLIDKLATLAPNLEIYAIPSRTQILASKNKFKLTIPNFTIADTSKSLILLVFSTMIGFLFYYLKFSESNIIMIYILGVLFTAVVTEGTVYSGVSSVLAVLTFNYFFTEPRFSLEAYNPGYPFTFLVMFICAFLTSTLTKRSKLQARLSSMKAYLTEVLLETSQKLQRAKDKNQIFHDIIYQITKLLDRTVVLYPIMGNSLGEPLIVTPEKDDLSTQRYLTKDEHAVAQWVYKNNKHAGATTNTLTGAKCLYMAVRSRDTVYAVVAIAMDMNPKIDAYEKNLLVAMLSECALALEKEDTLETNTEITLRAKQEQLRANLLRAISHDLRTPLTGISGNASLLMENSALLCEEKKVQLYTDIYDDSMWLINLVENLLSISRIDNGTITIKMEPELVEEVINEALFHVNRKFKEHNIIVKLSDDMLMAKMDASLITQVIINIVDNAIKYTEIGSNIEIASIQKGSMVEISVADDGNGIPDEAKGKLFDMFFTAENANLDSRRGLGLGLALCKSIVAAHGGNIFVKNNSPKGTIICFTLEAENKTIQTLRPLRGLREDVGINEKTFDSRH